MALKPVSEPAAVAQLKLIEPTVYTQENGPSPGAFIKGWRKNLELYIHCYMAFNPIK